MAYEAVGSASLFGCRHSVRTPVEETKDSDSVCRNPHVVEPHISNQFYHLFRRDGTGVGLAVSQYEIPSYAFEQMV